MVKVAIWCRHLAGDIIGIGSKIPWSVPSDVAKFVRIISGQNVVMGRKTYESLPQQDLPAEKIFILTKQEDYPVADENRHLAVHDLREFKNWEEDLYIAGGAEIYEQFLTGGGKLKPEIIVDCVYNGDINVQSGGEEISITPCIEVMEREYRPITLGYEKDQVTTTIYLKKGEFVEQAVLKSLLQDIEEE